MVNRLLITIIITIHTNHLFAQWTQTSGPLGIHASQIERLDNYLFVGGSISGLYRSADDGETWEPIEITPSNLHTNRLFVEGNRIYCSKLNGLFYSDNFGQNWSKVNTPFSLLNTYEIKGEEIYAVDFTSNKHYSLDFGETWEVLNTPNLGIMGISLEKLSGTLWLSSDNLYFSNNNGATWQTHSISVDYQVGFLVENQNYLYATASYRSDNTPYLLISSDNGVNWTPVPCPIPGVFSAITVDDGVITILSRSAYSLPPSLLTSFDSGQTWETKDVPEIMRLDLLRDGQTVYGLSFNGIFKSIDSGDNLELYTNGLKGTAIEKIVSQDQEVISLSMRQGVSYSSDLGLTWEYRNTGLGDFISPVDITVGLPNGFLATSQGVFKTNDGGLSWNQEVDLPNDRPFLLVASSNGNVVAVSYLDTYFSEDDGDTWNPKAPTELNNEHYTACSIQDDLVVLASETQLKVSTNFGDDWSIHSSPAIIREIEIIDDKIMVATDFGIYETSDFGANWNKVNTDNAFFSANSIEEHDGKLFASTEKGVFVSINGGSKWYPVNQGLKTNLTKAFLFHNGYAFVGTYGRAVWRSTVESLSITPVVNGLINPITLAKNQSYELRPEDLSVTDIDSSPEQFHVDLLPGSHYSVSGSLIIPETDYIGKLFVQTSVSDGYSNSPYINVTLSVEEPEQIEEQPTDVITSVSDDQLGFKVYPNPFSEVLIIEKPHGYKGIIKIYNALGEVVEQKGEIHTDQIFLDTRDLAPGMYYIKESEGRVLQSIKVIKINK